MKRMFGPFVPGSGSNKGPSLLELEQAKHWQLECQLAVRWARMPQKGGTPGVGSFFTML